MDCSCCPLYCGKSKNLEAAATEAKDEDPFAGLDLTDEETTVMKLLQAKSPAELNELKGQTGLSNKKWDTAVKGLRAKELAKVEKNDDGLWVSEV